MYTVLTPSLDTFVKKKKKNYIFSQTTKILNFLFAFI